MCASRREPKRAPGCLLCGEARQPVASAIGVCGACLRQGSARASKLATAAHRRPRREVGLPAVRPADPATTACRLCANHCQPGEGQPGLCGARAASGGRVTAVVGTPGEAAVSFWHDPLPTNCSAAWVCGASRRPSEAKQGLRNLAVGYHGCTFDCLYCQSWQTRGMADAPRHSARALADAADSTTRCVCFFGGDPTPQLAHAFAAARLARRRAVAERRPLRICFETNGAMNRSLLAGAIDLALESGGCIKFDLKAHHPTVHQALCGASNEQTLENFAYLASRRKERPSLPLAVATTLLVPGYIDPEEVRQIASFIAALGPEIPYSLLAFFSCFFLFDLPHTSVQQARRSLAAARSAGLTRVTLSGTHLLRDEHAG